MATQSVKFSDISATTAAFSLYGGRYAVAASATFGGGTVALQMLAEDGTTYVDLKAPFAKASDDSEEDLVIGSFSAAGMKVFDLPPGVYKITIATASAVYVSITQVPLAY